MIIGDETKFAIQLRLVEFEDDEYSEYNEEIKQKWLYANYCFFLNNVKIGRYNEWTSLTFIDSYINEFLENKDKRVVDNDFFNKTNKFIFNELYNKFFNTISVDNHILRMFHLDELGESSTRDKFGIVLISNKDSQKIIIHEFDTENYYSHILELDYVENVFIKLKEFIKNSL